MKSLAQKEAKKRRKEKAREFRELGKQAASQLAIAESSLEASEAAKELLRKEAAGLRSEHGRATSELSEIRRERDSLTVLLDGLRVELTEADAIVKALEKDKEMLTGRVAALERELEAAKLADSDARSLRTRLATKSREIDDLRAKLNRAEAALAEEKRNRPLVLGAAKKSADKQEM